MLVLALSVFPLTTHAESEFGDVTASQPELVAKYQTEANARGEAQHQAAIQNIIAQGNAGGYAVTVESVHNGQTTIFGNEKAVNGFAMQQQQDMNHDANITQHLSEHRAAVAQQQQFVRQLVESGKDMDKHVPAEEKKKVQESYQQELKTLTSGFEKQNKDADEYEAKVKAAEHGKYKNVKASAPRTLVSVEKDKS